MDRKELRKLASHTAHSAASADVQKWWLILRCGTAGLLVCFVLHLIYTLISKGEAKEGGKGQPIQRVSIEDMEAGAMGAAKGFLAAQSVEEKAQFVFDRERVLPLMRDYYERHPMSTKTFRELVDTKYHVAGGREFLMGTAVFEDLSGESWIFEKDSESREMLIQWEVVVHYSKTDWETFLDDRSTTGETFRVTVEMVEEAYYNYAFTDPEKYLCLIARVPTSERYVYAYLDKLSDSYKAFAPVRLMSDLAAMPIIAVLKFPESAEAGDQVEIERILSHSWVEGVEM